jgi:hypothetical protein
MKFIGKLIFRGLGVCLLVALAFGDARASTGQLSDLVWDWTLWPEAGKVGRVVLNERLEVPQTVSRCVDVFETQSCFIRSCDTAVSTEKTINPGQFRIDDFSGRFGATAPSRLRFRISRGAFYRDTLYVHCSIQVDSEEELLNLPLSTIEGLMEGVLTFK